MDCCVLVTALQKEKKKAFWKLFIKDNKRKKTVLSPKKQKCILLKLIYIYIHPYSETDSRKLFGNFGNGKEDNKSNIRQ